MENKTKFNAGAVTALQAIHAGNELVKAFNSVRVLSQLTPIELENNRLKLRIEELEAENKIMLASGVFPVKKIKNKAKKSKTGWYKHSKNDFPKWLIYIDFEKESFHGFDNDGKFVRDNWGFQSMPAYLKHAKLIPAKKSEVIKRLLNESEFEIKR